MIPDEQAQRERAREKSGFWLGVKTTLIALVIIAALIFSFYI